MGLSGITADNYFSAYEARSAKKRIANSRLRNAQPADSCSGSAKWAGDMVISKQEKMGGIAYDASIDRKEKSEMTMEEYKQYIHDKISQIPMHPSRMQESISVRITEAGFEAMKNDPEYEAWVLNDLRTGWAQPDPWAGICGGAYSTIHYGATKEECNAQMWSAGYQNGSGKSLFDSKANDSFWERRAEQSRKRKKQYEEFYEEMIAKRAANAGFLQSQSRQSRIAQAMDAYEAMQYR